MIPSKHMFAVVYFHRETDMYIYGNVMRMRKRIYFEKNKIKDITSRFVIMLMETLHQMLFMQHNTSNYRQISTIHNIICHS